MDYTYKSERIDPGLLFAAVSEALATGHSASFTVTGMSMWPFMCHLRDQVVVEKCDPAALRVGDIVLLQTPLGNYLLHRVTSRRQGFCETTGDGNCFRDGWFPQDCVKARVKTVLRNGRPHDCGSSGWKFLSAFWRVLYPVRRPLLRLLRYIGHSKAKYKKNNLSDNTDAGQ